MSSKLSHPFHPSLSELPVFVLGRCSSQSQGVRDGRGPRNTSLAAMILNEVAVSIIFMFNPIWARLPFWLIFFGLKPPTSQQFSYHLHIGLLKMTWKNWAVILGVNEGTYSGVCVCMNFWTFEDSVCESQTVQGPQTVQGVFVTQFLQTTNSWHQFMGLAEEFGGSRRCIYFDS